MKHLLHKLSYWFDYYFAYFLYNGNKRKRYHRYMEQKYGKNFRQKNPQ